MIRKNTRIHILLAVAVLLLATAGCANSAGQPAPVAAPESVTLLNPLGPAVIPVTGLASGKVSGDVQVDLQYWKTADEVTGLLSNGTAQFAVLPVTTGANMAAAGLDLVLLGVHEWKAFYLVAAEDAAFDDWDSLRGQTIYTPEAKGQTVDVITRYALAQNGIQPDQDVTFVYAAAAEIVTQFKEGQIAYAALPEPFVTQALTATSGRVVLDYQTYWSQASGAQDGIPIAGLFVTRDFYEAYPEISQEVAALLSDSTAWANTNPDEAAEACTEILPLPQAVLRSAMDRLAFSYVPATGAKQEVLDFLTAIQQTDPDSVKAVPTDDFFAGE